MGFRKSQAVFIHITSCTMGMCMWDLGTVKPCLYTSLAVLRVLYVGFRYGQVVFILVTRVLPGSVVVSWSNTRITDGLYILCQFCLFCCVIVVVLGLQLDWLKILLSWARENTQFCYQGSHIPECILAFGKSKSDIGMIVR